MIPLIGLMIGPYIITRMTDLITTKDANLVGKVLALLTIIITLFCLYGLIATAADTSSSLGMP